MAIDKEVKIVSRFVRKSDRGDKTIDIWTGGGGEVVIGGSKWDDRREGDTEFLHTDKSIVVGGGITMMANVDDQPMTDIYEGLPIDGKTIKRRTDGVLYVDVEYIKTLLQ